MTNQPLALCDNGEVEFLFVLPWFAGDQGGTSFPVMPGVGVEFPYSIAVLIAYLENQGISTALLDLGLEGDPHAVLRAVLSQRAPRVVGISCFSANIACADEVAGIVKQQSPKIPVILGGFHASAMPKECLTQYDHFDFAMHGECELSLPGFVKDLLNGRVDPRTPNLVMRTENGIRVNGPGEIIENLDDLPFPALDKVDFRRYRPLPSNFAQLPTFGLMSSRGCPFKCTFCATHFLWNKSLRKMSAAHTVDMIQKIVVDYKTRDFRFYDDIFTIPPKFCVEFCEEVLRRKLKITWNCYSRVDTITENLAKLMKRAGCYHVKFGIEAGTQRSLDRIQKGVEIERAVKAVRMVKRIGIEVKSSFILGIDGETFEESKATVEFSRRLAPDLATFLVMMVYPGSEDFENFKKAGKIPQGFRWDKPLYANEENIDQLQELARRAYRYFYVRPGFVIDRLKHLLRHPLREARRFQFSLQYMLEKRALAKRQSQTTPTEPGGARILVQRTVPIEFVLAPRTRVSQSADGSLGLTILQG